MFEGLIRDIFKNENLNKEQLEVLFSVYACGYAYGSYEALKRVQTYLINLDQLMSTEQSAGYMRKDFEEWYASFQQ
ncbi:hypothetical protein GF380_00580 [Candidatus Uhrbacteria bacterium]|nr:hypothetical protein [Candidatus Uhrbacteria bacterium]